MGGRDSAAGRRITEPFPDAGANEDPCPEGCLPFLAATWIYVRAEITCKSGNLFPLSPAAASFGNFG
jgi:hypothetical protein